MRHRHSSLVNSTKSSCLMASPWRMSIYSSTSTRCSLQAAGPPKSSQTRVTLLVPHFRAWNPVLVRWNFVTLYGFRGITLLVESICGDFAWVPQPSYAFLGEGGAKYRSSRIDEATAKTTALQSHVMFRFSSYDWLQTSITPMNTRPTVMSSYLISDCNKSERIHRLAT